MAEMDPNLAALIEKITAAPETRKKFVKILKEVEPSWQLPADVAVDDLRAEFEAKRAEDRQQAESQRIRDNLESKRRSIAERYGEEAVQHIEKDVMEKYGIPDYEVAAKVYAAEQPPPERESRDHQIARHDATWQMPQVDLAAFMENPKKAALDAAYKVVDEFRGRK